MKKIYLASSWRNTYQADVLAALRAASFEVYDFKNPEPGNNGFSWKQCDPDLKSDLTVDRMRSVLAHPVAQAGFDHDFNAMKWADVCVLLLPSGMSAHLEAGWFGGKGKPVAVLAPEIREPELMYKMFDWIDKPNVGQSRAEWRTPLFATVDEVVTYLRSFAAHYPRGMGDESRRLHREYNALVAAQNAGAKNGAEVVRITDECNAKGIILVPGGENL